MVAKAKVLRLDPPVLQAFQNMTWSDDGTRAVFNEQLGPLWAKVKKVFEGLEGRWDKKEKAIIFPTDPRDQIEGLVKTGTMEVARDGFFRTPKAVFDTVFSYMNPEKLEGNWLEPECGDGAGIDYIISEGYAHPENVFGIEINAKRAALVKQNHPGVHVANGDFMRYLNSAGIRFRYVFANPPFEDGQDAAHARRIYSLLSKGGKAGIVLGEGVFFRDDQRSQTFRQFLKATGAYVEKLPEKSFHSSGTDVNTRFIILEK